MNRVILAALLLLPGCSVAVANDAESACHVIDDAMRAQAARCDLTWHATETLCDGVAYTNKTADDASECRAWAEAVACKDALPYIEACQITVSHWPL